MYLEKAIFVNRAPFEKLELDFKEKGVNVLTAINGKGKTTILSHITDAFFELAKSVFSDSFKGIENSYYRISSSLYNLKRGEPSFVYFRFKNNDKHVDYIDVRGNCTNEQYDSAISIDTKILYGDIKHAIKSSNNVKRWSKLENNEIKDLFAKNLMTYFPSYRFEQPSYLNDPYLIRMEFSKTSKFSNQMLNTIEVVSDLPTLANWLLDVLLDMKLSEEGAEQRIFDGKLYRQVITTQEKSTVWNNLNIIISQTLSSKFKGEKLRLGIGYRNDGASRVCVTNDSRNNSVPLFNLSAGELSLISLFGEVLHQADNNRKNKPLNDITGIVLVDEVDKHLHMTLQKEILPKLFALFPNVQFIVSSHSPFLNMGLAESCSDTHKIFDLDNDGHTYVAEKNDEYLKVYNMMINENLRYAEKYNELSLKVNHSTKPVVITEGKTDWKHFKAALSYFKANDEFEDLDIELLEYEFDFGDSKLDSLLKQYKTFPPRYKVVGIFDCDESNGKRIHNSSGKVKYGDNVWGMSIPIPHFREYNKSGISIEFLYKDVDLKRKDEKGRRLFVTSEFNENGRLIVDNRIGVKNNHDVKNYILPDKEKIQADEVIDIEGNSLALSKEDFASNILQSEPLFHDMDFEAFRPVFERLRDILNT